MIGSNGEQFGIIPVEEALKRAEADGLDLVEVSPKSRPPVCRILDYGKFKYEIAKKDKLAKKKQHNTQMKEMRYRPKIDEHDYQFKTKHVKEFLSSGHKVRCFVMFRGREMAYQEFGRKVLDRLKVDLAEIAEVELQPKMEGRHMNMVLIPAAEVMKKLRKKKAKDQTKALQAKNKEKSKQKEESTKY